MTKYIYSLLLPLQLTSMCCHSDQASMPDSDASSAPTVNRSFDGGINRSVPPMVSHGWNVWVEGEGLYWKAAEENIPYVIVDRRFPPSTTPHYTIQDGKFDWNGGYRLSAGYMIPHDEWDIRAIWTSISNQGSRSNNGTIPPDRTVNLIEPVGYQDTIQGIITHTSGKWKVDLSQIDLILGKEFFVSRSLTLRPMGGARSAWIDHSGSSGYFNHNDGMTDTHSLKWDFWGFGFLAGVQADWILARDWSIFSFADCALLWGFSKIRQHSPTTGYRYRESFRCARAVYDVGMGLKWSHLFHNERWRLSFKAGYEYHLYPNQNQMINNTSMVDLGTAAGAFINNPGDLTYQGPSFSAQIDF